MALLPLTGSVTTDGVGTNANIDAFGAGPFDLRAAMLRVTLVVDDVTRLAALNLFAGISGLASSVKWRFAAFTGASKLGKSGEPFTVLLQRAEIQAVTGVYSLSPTGGLSPDTGFTDLRLQVQDAAAGAVTVTVLSAEMVPAARGGVVSVTFDDGWESVFSRAYPVMRERGIPGTVYAITDLVGAGDRVTVDALERVVHNRPYPWEVAGHAFAGAAHGLRYTGLTAAQVQEDLVQLRDWLVDRFPHDSGVYNFAYSGGQYEDTSDGAAVEQLVRTAGFTTGRTILSSTADTNHVQIAHPRPVMPMRLYAMSSISSAASPTSPYNPANLAGTGGMLDRVAVNGGWLILTFHRIISDAATPVDASEIRQADFESVMDGIADHDLTVATVRDVVLANR